MNSVYLTTLPVISSPVVSSVRNTSSYLYQINESERWVFVWQSLQSHKNDMTWFASTQRDMFGRTLLVVATIFLFHAAYSAYEDLSHLKTLGKPEGSLPLNTVYESIVALILGTLGASLNAPPLKDITWASEMNKRTIDDMDSRLGFANYHSRGKSFLVPLPSGQS